MRTLLILDTCGAEGGVALARLNNGDATVLAERTLPGRGTQEHLMLALDEVLREAAVPIASVDVLGIVTGPGSFTGVRIGMAAVKGLAEALQKPVVAVSRLAVLAAQAVSEDPVQAWLDAGRGDIFAGRYQHGERLWERMLSGSGAIDGRGDDHVVVMEPQLAERAPFAQLAEPVSVRQALPLMAALAATGTYADTALLDANYLRVPDAELARIARETA